jgi:hypothetical protein
MPSRVGQEIGLSITHARPALPLLVVVSALHAIKNHNEFKKKKIVLGHCQNVNFSGNKKSFDFYSTDSMAFFKGEISFY